MRLPHLAAQSKQLFFKQEPDSITIQDLERGGTRKVVIGRLGYRDIVVAPDGRFAVVPLTLTHPLAYLGYPTIVDLNDPTKRYYLEGFDYCVDWTAEDESPAK
jgi:hypothetical protein